MKQIHLAISTNYVSHWGFWEAVRELLQNAIDAGSEHYSEMTSNGVMKIQSSGGTLSVSSLALGESSKRDDDNLIGKYGEGYKLALLVLCRLGKRVLIKNGFDCWSVGIGTHPELDVECLVVDIHKDSYCDDLEHENCVSFVITDVTDSEFKIVQQNYINHSRIADHGIDIIAENDGSYCFTADSLHDCHKVFVGGLYVCDLDDSYRYSYNFKPNLLQLDRDRGAVDEFYLQREATNLFADSGNIELLIDLASQNAKDVSSYYSVKESKSFSSCSSNGFDGKTVKIAVNSFKGKHGENAYPVSDDVFGDKKRIIMERCVAMGYVPVTVKKVLHEIIIKEYEGKLKVEKIHGKISDNLTGFVKKNRNKIQPIARKRLLAIIDSIKMKGE